MSTALPAATRNIYKRVYEHILLPSLRLKSLYAFSFLRKSQNFLLPMKLRRSEKMFYILKCMFLDIIQVHPSYADTTVIVERIF